MNVKLILGAKKFEDSDDSLAAAVAHVAKQYKVPASRVTVAWGDTDGEPDVDDRSRETIIATIAGR